MLASAFVGERRAERAVSPRQERKAPARQHGSKNGPGLYRRAETRHPASGWTRVEASDLKLRSGRPVTAAELFRERLRRSLREALSDVAKQPPTPEQAELVDRLEKALERAC